MTLPVGEFFLLLTDHSNLTNFFNQSGLNARQARCKTFLNEFDFEMEHLRGKENQVVDALSRKVHCIYEV